MTDTASVAFHKKRRKVLRSSTTKLETKLTDLEDTPDSPTVLENARSLAEKLKSLKQDFKNHQLAIIDRIDDEEELEEEQQALDDFDDIATNLSIRLQRLISQATPAKVPDSVRVAGRQLALLQADLQTIGDMVSGLDLTDAGVECSLEEYRDRVSEVKSELSKLRTSLVASEAEGDVMTDLARIERLAFDCLLTIKKQIRSIASAAAATMPVTTDTTSTKLPKLELPSFHGDILQWKGFWEQFCVSVHDRTAISQEEKLMYLQNAIKDKTAKNLIAGLTKTSDHYTEAVKCLQERYDRPRQIHQTHVRRIVEAPSLKDGTGKEIRALHDLVIQHLRALKALGHEPSQAFITSLLEMKLDSTTMFEWQRHSQGHNDVPDYQELLDFLNLRAQASEASTEKKRANKTLPSMHANVAPSDTNCVSCGKENHPLYMCNKFRSLPHSSKMELLRSRNHCINCLRPGHIAKKCKSLNHCKQCQRPHHTLLHSDGREREDASKKGTPATNPIDETRTAPALHVSVQTNVLLMTCQVMVESPHGKFKARALLDTGSSASFISEHLAQTLQLSRHSQNARICGIAGVQHSDGRQSVTQFNISSVYSPSRRHVVNAFIVPRITGDLPLCTVPPDPNWSHLNGLFLADPEYCQPGKVDILLGVGVFVEVIRHGRRSGPPNSPTALNTDFGWVLAGDTGPRCEPEVVSTHLTSVVTSDDLLRKFWEVEEKMIPHSTLTVEERHALDHFNSHHTRDSDGRFVVPLPKRVQQVKLGESRSQAVRRFLSFERSTRFKSLLPEVQEVVHEYFDKGHAEEVPQADMEKPQDKVFYLPIHVVLKESSSTTKVRAVFDASAVTSTGVSLNSTLMAGPTVHPPLVDVLIRFRNHRIALIADISRMYRAVCLTESDKDLHRFVWRDRPGDALKDFRMRRLTFGVSASSFIANMCVKQNAIDFGSLYPNAAKQVDTSYYVDDYLGGADSREEAIQLQGEMQSLFSRGGFLLRKWKCSDPCVLANISPELKDAQATIVLSESEQYTKTLGIEWDATNDHFRVNITELPPMECMTKRSLISDVAKTFDALGWFSPVIVKAKILLQMLWLEKVDWDDPVPEHILEQWLKWRRELPVLSTIYVSRCYYPKSVTIASIQLHGFSDASEKAYSGVVYLRMEDTHGTVHTSLVSSKTRVAPIKPTTIPRLELNGALILAQLLSHCKEVLEMPVDSVYAWTDSTIVLAWLQGSPRRFKLYVANRVAQILDLIPASHWSHVVSEENPADCASRGIYPSELLHHGLWWHGPAWMKLASSDWPSDDVSSHLEQEEVKELITPCNVVVVSEPLIPIDKFSSFDLYKRVTAWISRFIHNCKARIQKSQTLHGPLRVEELNQSASYWYSVMQEAHFSSESKILKSNNPKLPTSSKIRSLNPMIDEHGILRVGGRQENSKFSYDTKHPIILSSKHPLCKLLIRSEHKRLLHGGSVLVSSSLFRTFHIIGGHRAIRSIVRSCVTCRRRAPKPKSQMMGQLPSSRITPDIVFEHVGLDYAGPLYLKRGSVRKPSIVKCYVCVFISMSVKAVHLELVSDLTTEAFIASLRRFTARRGKPISIWSDHGTNFVGANRTLKEIYAFLLSQQTESAVIDFCGTQGIKWHFIPERAPHFGGLWEAAVKSLKVHLSRVMGNVKLDYEEMYTVLTQIEACLNSRPLGGIPDNNEDGIEMLTPGHFLIGRPLQAIPDNSKSFQKTSLLRRWHLCQNLVRHFWGRWKNEYLAALRKYPKWKDRTENMKPGDIVVLKEDNAITCQWPLARVVNTNAGADGLVRVVTLKTQNGTYKRPITKVAPLVPCDY